MVTAWTILFAERGVVFDLRQVQIVHTDAVKMIVAYNTSCK